MARLNRPRRGTTEASGHYAAGELHEIGVLAGAVLAGTRGYQVACLGPNLPACEILFAVERFAPRILLMGLITPDPLPAALETVRTVAALMAASTELWLGGTGALVALDEIHRPGTIFLDDLQMMERLLVERRRERLP